MDNVDLESHPAFKDETFVAEFLAPVSFDRFYNLYAALKPDESSILDGSAVAQRIIEQGDRGKMLVIAMFGAGGLFSQGMKDEQLLLLAETSAQHRLALLSNVRVDWYSHSYTSGPAPLRDGLLLPAILNGELEVDRFGVALLKNPRMDRRFIADVIRGKGEFAALAIEERILAASLALGVPEIKSRDYYGKDSPDSNERHFGEPATAAIILVREAYRQKVNLRRLQHVYGPAIRHMLTNGLRLDDADWLTEAELQDTKHDDFMIQFDKRRKLARSKLFGWIRSITPDDREPKVEGDGDGEDDYEVFALAERDAFFSLVVREALGSSDPKPFVKSKDWRIRAGAYVALFEGAIPRWKPGIVKAAKRVVRRHRRDRMTALRGVALSKKFWKGLSRENVDFETFVKKAGVRTDDQLVRLLAGDIQSMIYPEGYSEIEPKAVSEEVQLLQRLASQLNTVWYWIIAIAVMVGLLCWRILL